MADDTDQIVAAHGALDTEPVADVRPAGQRFNDAMAVPQEDLSVKAARAIAPAVDKISSVISESLTPEQASEAAGARETAGRVQRRRAVTPQDQPARIAPGPDASDEEVQAYYLKGVPQDNGVENVERMRLNAVESQYRGTIFGAARLSALANIYQMQDPAGITAEQKKANEDAREEYVRIMSDLAAFDIMPGWNGLPQLGSALIGSLGGSLTSPESFLGWASTGATGAIRTLRAAFQQGVISAGSDLAIQPLNLQAGAQEHFEWLKPVGAFVGGAAVGGLFHAGGEGVSLLFNQRALRKEFYDLGSLDKDFTNVQRDLWAYDPRNGIEVEMPAESVRTAGRRYGEGPKESFEESLAIEKKRAQEVDTEARAADPDHPIKQPGERDYEARTAVFEREVGESFEHLRSEYHLDENDLNDLSKIYDRQAGEHPQYALERAVDEWATLDQEKAMFADLNRDSLWEADLAAAQRIQAAHDDWASRQSMIFETGNLGNFRAGLGDTVTVPGRVGGIIEREVSHDIPFESGLPARDGGGVPAGGAAPSGEAGRTPAIGEGAAGSRGRGGERAAGAEGAGGERVADTRTQGDLLVSPDERGDQALRGNRQAPYPFEQRRDPETGAAKPTDLSPEQDIAVRSLQQQAMALAEAIGFPLRQGRVSIAGAAGIYKGRSGVVRVKEVPDFATVSHEAGHAIEAKVGRPMTDLIQKNALELGRLDYDVDRADPAEGFAEWIRIRLGGTGGGRSAERIAPNFSAEFNALMTERLPEILKALNDAATSYQRWLDASSVDAVKAVVVHVKRDDTGVMAALKSAKEEGIAPTVTTVLQKSYTKLIDSLAPIEESVRDLLRIIQEKQGGGIVELLASADPYKMFRAYERTPQAAIIQLQRGVFPYHGTEAVGPSMDAAISHALGGRRWWQRWDNEKVQQFDHYLASRRIEYLWRRFDEGLMLNEPAPIKPGDARQAISDLERANPNFREAADMVHEFLKNLRQKKRDAGLFDQKTFDDLSGHEFYVPLNRDMSDKSIAASGSDKSGRILKGRVQRQVGSERDILSPLENIKMAVFHAENDIRMNDIRNALADLGERATGEGGKFVEVLPSHEAKKYKVDLEDLIRGRAKEKGLTKEETEGLVNALRDDDDPDAPLMASWFSMEQTQARGEPILFAWRDGKPRVMRVMSERSEGGRGLYETMTAAPTPIVDAWVGLVTTFAGLARGGIVTEPTFIVSNLIRDQIQMALTRPGYIPFVGAVKGLVQEVRQDPIAVLRTYMGGEVSGVLTGTIEHQWTREIADMRQRGYLVQRVQSWKHALEAMQVTEAATRNSIFEREYKYKLNQGLAPWDALFEAAHQADDIMAFSRHGSKMLAVRNMVPFLGANIQGQDKYVWRTMIEPLLKKTMGLHGGIITKQDQEDLTRAGYAWMMAGAGAMALGMAYRGLTDDDEGIRTATPEFRGKNIMIPRSDGKYWAFPKPFEMGFGFTIGEYAYEGMMQEDPRWAAQMKTALIEGFSVPDPIRNMAMVTPTVELISNHSFYTGRPIVPDRVQNRAHPELEYTERTSSMGKEVGKIMGWSPMKVDYAVGAFFGTWGRNALSASSSLDESAPAQALDDVMFLRRFIKDGERVSGRARQFWDYMASKTGRYSEDAKSYHEMVKQAIIKGEPITDATALLNKLPAPEQVYVALAEGARPDGRQAFTADDRRLHPLTRAREAATLLGGLARELSTNTFVPYREKERVTLDPETRRKLIDEVRTLSGMEMRNAFAIVGEPGYAGKQVFDTNGPMEMIRHYAPNVADEIGKRYAAAKIYTTDAVREAWPQLRDEIVANGTDARLSGITARARSQGYEFGSMRTKKPASVRQPIAGMTSVSP